MKKVDAWAILRFEEDKDIHSSSVSIKGVYDNEQAAYLALEKVQISKENYAIERTRRFTEEDCLIQQSQPLKETIQGLELSQFKENNYNDTFSSELNNIKELWNKLPIKIAQKTLVPLLNYVIESTLAETLGAEISQPNQQYDLRLNTGEKIEIKIVILDPQKPKSPTLQFPENIPFDFLVIVLFRPDLTIATAKMIPAGTLAYFSRPLSNQKSLINIRVTPSLLNHPDSKDINLGYIDYCESLVAS